MVREIIPTVEELEQSYMSYFNIIIAEEEDDQNSDEEGSEENSTSEDEEPRNQPSATSKFNTMLMTKLRYVEITQAEIKSKVDAMENNNKKMFLMIQEMHQKICQSDANDDGIDDITFANLDVDTIVANAHNIGKVNILNFLYCQYH